ncbi:MAG: aminotransferase class I/II-fold pyridoxal phosphate-dependent enzyme [Flavobacterium sp.]
MKFFPDSLSKKLQERIQTVSLRVLPDPSNAIDFSSNDYLGFAKNESLFEDVHQFLVDRFLKQNGATGSRLLSGNHTLYPETENYIAEFHQAEAALIFNSGYDANIGFFSAVPQRNDIVLFDELCHASIRDGIQMGLAQSFKFKHNDFSDLKRLLQKFKNQKQQADSQIYVVTESVFSMDGDRPKLPELIALTQEYHALVVIDEAHAVGVMGPKGVGSIQEHDLQDLVFARIVTFGKALGVHGAAILGSNSLKHYLVNFARSFIYTTGLSPHAVASIYLAYQKLKVSSSEREALFENIRCFQEKVLELFGLQQPHSPIQSIIIPGNERVKWVASQLQQLGFDVKPILSPTVPKGAERLRFCLHSYNTREEIKGVLHQLKTLQQSI